MYRRGSHGRWSGVDCRKAGFCEVSDMQALANAITTFTTPPPMTLLVNSSIYPSSISLSAPPPLSSSPRDQVPLLREGLRPDVIVTGIRKHVIVWNMCGSRACLDQHGLLNQIPNPGAQRFIAAHHTGTVFRLTALALAHRGDWGDCGWKYVNVIGRIWLEPCVGSRM